jgi:hypothetical protein
VSSYLSRKAVFLSTDGGQIDFVRDGEVLASVSVPAGRVNAVDYIDLLPDGAEIEVSHGLAVMEPRSRIRSGSQAYGEGAYHSGANPDFQPTSASRMENQLRLLASQMQADTRRIDARLRALQSIETMPKAPEAVPSVPAPAVDDAPVIE